MAFGGAQGGGAPVGASYLNVGLDAGLTAERRLVAGTGITFVDGGADGDFTISATGTGTDHGLLTGLGDDDHSIYALLAGRSGGQVFVGGADASDSVTIRATANASAGTVIFQTNPSTNAGRFLSTGQLLVFRTAAVDSTRIAEFGTDSNSSQAIAAVNQTDGTAARADCIVDQGTGGSRILGGITATSTSFTPTADLDADAVTLSSTGAAGGIQIRTFDDTPVTLMRNNAAVITLQASSEVLFAGEVEIDGDIDHDGSNIGFFGTVPAAQAGAYTQTFATADRTHAARVAATLTDNSGGTADTTIAAITQAANGGSADVGPTADAIADLAAQVNNLITDQQDTAAVVNALVDDLQSYGLVQ